MAGDVNLSISNDVIKSIVESKIKAEVTAALAANSERMIAQMADNVIKTKVDREGRPTSSSWDTMNMLDYMLNKEVKAIVETVLKEWLESQKDKIKAAIVKSLDKNKDRFADDFVHSIISESKTGLNYRLSVSTPGFKDSVDQRLSAIERKLKD